MTVFPLPMSAESKNRDTAKAGNFFAPDNSDQSSTHDRGADVAVKDFVTATMTTSSGRCMMLAVAADGAPTV